MDAVWDRIQAIPAGLAAVSPMDKAHTAKAQADLKHAYPMLSDKGNGLAKKLNLAFAFTDALQKAYKSFGVNLAEYNGDESWILPMPAIFVVAPGGKITWRYVNADYTKRAEPETVLEELRKAANGAQAGS